MSDLDKFALALFFIYGLAMVVNDIKIVRYCKAVDEDYKEINSKLYNIQDKLESSEIDD